MNTKEKELFNYIIEQTDNGNFQWTKNVTIENNGFVHYQYRIPDMTVHSNAIRSIFAEKVPNTYACVIRVTSWNFYKNTPKIITLIPENLAEFAVLERAIIDSINEEEVKIIKDMME